MILYILKSGLLFLILITVYKLFLENENMHQFKRYYLLISLVFAIIVPLQLFSIQTEIVQNINVFQLNEVLTQRNRIDTEKIAKNQFFQSILILIYSLGVILLSARFTINLISFFKKIKRNQIENIDGNSVVLINERLLPHSFLNSIFINENDFKKDKINPELLVHETAHIQQKHSLDILFIEIIQIIFWFNPIVPLYKKAIKLNHEFLADQAVNNKFNSVYTYQTLLLNIASDKKRVALASPINYQITKKRLIMMTKNASKSKMIIKTIATSILFVTLLFVFGSKTVAQEVKSSTEKENINELPSEITQQPKFPGGMLAFYKFVGSNFITPAELKGKGRLYMTFMIEKDGSLSEFEILRDMGFGTGKEAIRVLKLCPKWIPGRDNNQPIRVKYNLPIAIQSN
ncbi:M56 family metallopeptidase [Flavobacterium sp. XS2P39]|uniref:M56 family metallopeptidase n=1 Tax=Flavobacterium sp. XS2P39 TaxID=3401725 RepID=UPI003AAEAE6F